MAVATLSTIQAVGGGNIAGQARFERRLRVTGPVEIVIWTGAGHVNVSRGESCVVEVRGTIRRQQKCSSEGNSLTRLAQLKAHPPIEQHRNIVNIGQIADPDLRLNFSISYDLGVPAESRLNLRTGSGSITVEGVGGPIDAETGSGAITICDNAGDVQATAASGEIEVRSVVGNVRASTGSGPIYATGIAGGFHATSARGSVEASDLGEAIRSRVTPWITSTSLQSEGDEKFAAAHRDSGSTKPPILAHEVRVRTISGGIHLRNTRGQVHASTACGPIQIENDESAGAFSIKSVSGDVEVQLPSSVGLEIRVRTVWGSMDLGRPMTIERTSARDSFAAKSGDGGVRLELATVSGSIKVR